MTAFIPMHPEGTDDAQTVRWVVPVGVLPVVGAIHAAPGEFGALLADGMLAEVAVESQAVVVRLADGASWGEHGARVRDALAGALARPHEWRPALPVTPDDVLRAALTDLLDGSVGDFIRSHGGEVHVVSIADGRVRLRMAGSCAHCPALAFTLHGRIESELRRRYPALVDVKAAAESGAAHRPLWRPARRSA